jgi:hypothetical protein
MLTVWKTNAHLRKAGDAAAEEAVEEHAEEHTEEELIMALTESSSSPSARSHSVHEQQSAGPYRNHTD